MTPLLTTEEVAEYLRVDVVTVRRLVNRGELTAYRVGSEYRFTPSDLEAYLQGQRVSGGEEEAEMPRFALPKQLFKGRHGERDRFDKFTGRARKVLTFAQEEARHLNHNYVGTEHLLLGLVHEGEGIAGRVLSNLGVRLELVRSSVEAIIGRGNREVHGEIGLTPRAKKVIELAVEEARRFGHKYIGTEHLLLGLIREGEGIGAGVLKSLGVNLAQARQETLRLLSEITRTNTEEALTEMQQPAEEQQVPPPPVPAEASSLLSEGEQGLTCSRCGARNLVYFHHCFNCGQLLASKEQA